MMPPESFIAILRASDPVFMLDLFKNGGCWHLFTILRAVWPEAEPWLAWEQGHVYTKIGPAWYDIEGKHIAVDDGIAFTRMDLQKARKAARWLRTRLDKHVGRLCDCGNGADGEVEPASGGLGIFDGLLHLGEVI